MLLVGTDPHRIPFTPFSLSVGLRGCPNTLPFMVQVSSGKHFSQRASSRRCNESGTPSTRQRWEPEIVSTSTRSYRNEYRRLRPSHSSADESGQTACRSPTDSGDLLGSGGGKCLLESSNILGAGPLLPRAAELKLAVAVMSLSLRLSNDDIRECWFQRTNSMMVEKSVAFTRRITTTRPTTCAVNHGNLYRVGMCRYAGIHGVRARRYCSVSKLCRAMERWMEQAFLQDALRHSCGTGTSRGQWDPVNRPLFSTMTAPLAPLRHCSMNECKSQVGSHVRPVHSCPHAISCLGLEGRNTKLIAL